MNNNRISKSRINSYVNYLPSYSPKYIDYLVEQGRITEDLSVADIGAGAGILSRLIATHVKRVLAVEPDENMRQAAKVYCQDTENITFICGTAETTGLDSDSVDLITTGQAFHYFHIDETLKEFKRILKSEGKVAIAWHRRATDYPFGQEFEALLRQYCPDYKGTTGAKWPAGQFYKKGVFEYRTFTNNRSIDLETLMGYALSMPFSPVKSAPCFSGFVENLTAIYDKHADHGKLELRALIESYIGEI